MPTMTSGVLGLVAALVMPGAALAQAQGAFQAGPGTVNYLQGQVAVNGVSVEMKQAGLVRAQAGQIISTGNGKAEIGVAPGVFIRLGANSVLRMVNEDPANAEIALERGKADVQVDQQYHQTGEVVIDVKGEGVQLIKPGVYGLDAALGLVKVFDGEAVVLPSDTKQKEVKVKGGHEVALNAPGVKPHEFDRAAAEDDLYRWGMGQNGAEERGGGYAGYGPEYGFAASPYLYGDGFYPYGYGFYPGIGIGFGYGGFGYGRFGYGGFGGYRGGFGGFRGGRR